MIRVHIETASPITRAGLEALLEANGGIELTASASRADVILSDRTHDPHHATPLPSVILSTHRLNSSLAAAGVHAVLPPEAPPDQIVAALYAAAAGLYVTPPDSVPVSDPEPHIESLTAREMEVLEMLAEGLINKEIAARLNISEHTAKFHVNSILNKLGAGTRTEAVVRSLRRGLLKV